MNSNNTPSADVGRSTKAGRLASLAGKLKDPSSNTSRKTIKQASNPVTNTATAAEDAKPIKLTRQASSVLMRQTRLNLGPKAEAASPLKESETAVSPSKQSETTASTAAAAMVPTPPSNKRKRAPTEHKSIAKYAHLNKVPDTITPNLILVLVGNNPGVTTAEKGHPYSHPSNLFWKLLHSSGCTPTLLKPEEHRTLPELYSLGQTNIVSRPTKDASELTKDEMVAGAVILEKKFAEFRPEAVCIVGKGIWEAIWRCKYGKSITKKEFEWGWQDERHNMGRVKGEFKGSKVFVATSTSGLAASLSRSEKEEIWRPLGDFVKRRRLERMEQVAG